MGGDLLYAGAVETVFTGRHAWWGEGDEEHYGDDEQWHLVYVVDYASLEEYAQARGDRARARVPVAGGARKETGHA